MSDSYQRHFTNKRSPLTHTCSVPGCSVDLPAQILMCRSHWRKVPHALRALVWVAWEQWRCGDITLDELRTVQGRATATVPTCSAVSAAKGGAA